MIRRGSRMGAQFQSTPPVREETAKHTNVLLPKVFHIVQNHGASACTNLGIHRYSRDHPGFFWCEASPMQ